MPITPLSNNKDFTQNKTKENHSSNIQFELTKPRFTLNDLILSQHTYNELLRAISLREHQYAVFNEWGFKNTHKYDNKMIINLYGAPGTGKTMAAHAIASRLNRPLLIVNYGDIESKYVGETPKNIQAVFKFSKENNAILFFDEADAILSRRVTNMSNATDTSVNQTRSVMLTLLNDYNDTVLFATNFISNYDPAFMRRILMHIEFTLPDDESRRKLFELYIPKELPHSIKLDEVVKESENLSGSDIANCILLAAFSAKNEHRNSVTNDDVMEKILAIKKSKQANHKDQHGQILSIQNRSVSEKYVHQQLTK